MISSVFFISIVLSYFFLSVSRNYFIKNKLIDKINSRSSHELIATRSGGIAIYFTVFLLSLFFYFFGNEIYDFSVLIPLSILLLIGIYDDTKDADYKLKFIFQIIAAKIIIDNGLVIDNLHGIFGIYSLDRISAQVFTIFIIVSIINSINFIDGLDGLASSIIMLFILCYELLALNESKFFILSIILLGSLLTFLYFNLQNKRKVFLGDSGSLFLGGIASIYILNILSQEYHIKEAFDLNKMFFVVSIFSYPIIDITRVVIIRLTKGYSPFKADKNHIHHKLLEYQKSHIKVVITILTFQVILFFLIQFFFNK